MNGHPVDGSDTEQGTAAGPPGPDGGSRRPTASVASAEPVVLEGRDLVKHYRAPGPLWGPRRTVLALDGVTVELRRGRTLGVVGESGCGKSTLARLLTLLEPPTGGEVLIDGLLAPGTERQRRRIRRSVQTVLQDPFTALDPRLIVGDQIAEAMIIHRVCGSRPERAARVAELLELVGLPARVAGRRPHELSGGQRQRICIARALALDPAVVVCDEPVSALDASATAQIIGLLTDLQAELGLSYVVIAHDLDAVRRVANEVSVLYLGRVVETGPVPVVLDDPRHPYTRALASAVPVPDPTRRDEPRIVLAGEPPSPIDPPSGCPFRLRCWRATGVCAERRPDLEAVDGRLVACHHPGSDDPDQVGAPLRIGGRTP